MKQHIVTGHAHGLIPFVKIIAERVDCFLRKGNFFRIAGEYHVF